jgi:hypothetical protein
MPSGVAYTVTSPWKRQPTGGLAMAHFDGAVIKEQGVTFAIAVVRRSAIDDLSHRDETVAEFSAAFDGLPTVLMAQDASGRPTFYGRRDIVDFMSTVPIEAVPWSRYELN